METTDSFSMNNTVLSKYLGLLIEIIKRQEVIVGMHTGVCTAKYKIINTEVMFFQLRKILEILVKAPMIINESEYRDESNRPETDWRIREIMSNLEKANPNYFPKPIIILKKPGEMDEFINKTSGFLTKEELIEAYQHCNKFLHINNPLGDKFVYDYVDEWTYIVSTLDKITALLNTHIAEPIYGEGIYYIGMNNVETGMPFGQIFEK